MLDWTCLKQRHPSHMAATQSSLQTTMASKLSSDDLAATEPLLGSIDSPRLSLDELNEREIAENPTSTTQDAQAGVQKAEAAALVWSKSALYGIFAWYVTCRYLFPHELVL